MNRMLGVWVVLVGLVAMGCDAPKRAGEAAVSSAKPAETADLSTIADRIPEREEIGLDAVQASKLMQLSIGCVDRPFPNKTSWVYTSEESFVPPRRRTPAFYGCFDWHSAVHGHWAMVRVLKRFPGIDVETELRTKVGAHLTKANLEQELLFFREKENRTFERPYGWGWLLRLAAELHDWEDGQGREWSKNVEPFARFLAGQMAEYLPRLTVPIREGTHANTAFAMVHALDYARVVGDVAFERLLVEEGRRLYGEDRSCPTDYEPSGEDFISPCLVEADLMRRVLGRVEFLGWYEGFMPSMTGARFAPLLTPVEVKDPEDPRIGHLIGLAPNQANYLAVRGNPSERPRV